MMFNTKVLTEEHMKIFQVKLKDQNVEGRDAS